MKHPPGAVERIVRRWPELDADIRDYVAAEEPLEIRVEDRSIAITMRTPGSDRELAAGFLLTEGILEHRDDLVSLGPLAGDTDGNTVVAHVAGGVEAHAADIERATRALYATSACGICGKASLDRITLLAPPLPTAPPLAPEWLLGLPQRLSELQPVFSKTGGLHGAALFRQDGHLLAVAEDIGRHNAVDKVVGAHFLTGANPLERRLLVVSSRAGFEIVQKARMAGIATVAAVGAASSLAIELAERAEMTLVGFLRQDRFTLYTAPSSGRQD